MENIQYNLDVATPMFLAMINGLKIETAQYIQFQTTILEDSHIYFVFKSSQNSLNFKIYAGINIYQAYYLKIRGKREHIYKYFNNIILNLK